MTIPAFSLPPPRARLAGRDLLIAAVVFLSGLLLTTRHNGFPSFYHPDEPSKARQIIEGDFNFNHPLLLLQTTRLIVAVTQTPFRQQAITEAGRFASAIYAAGAMACAVLMAAHLRGTCAGLAAGALVLLNQQLYELAHYMKEDPALAFGIAVFFLALIRCSLAPSPARFAFLGVAAALAVSAKYIGALVIPLAAVPFLAGASMVGRPRCRPLPSLAAFVAAFLVAVALINFPMVPGFAEFTGNLGRELDYAVEGHKGVTRSVPHGVYGAVVREATNPGVWVLLILYYASLPFRWRSTQAAERALAIFPVAYVLILSFSPKSHHRYFLPDTVLLCILAALAVWSLPANLPWLQRAARYGILPLALVLSAWKTRANDLAFQQDPRRDLVAFVTATLPADAVIAQDKRVSLPSRADPRLADSPYSIPQKVVGKLFAADVGPLDELPARGIHYVAIAEGDYGRFFLKTHSARAGERGEYDRRRAFYETLRSKATLIWKCDSGPQQYLQPRIELYKLP